MLWECVEEAGFLDDDSVLWGENRQLYIHISIAPITSSSKTNLTMNWRTLWKWNLGTLHWTFLVMTCCQPLVDIWTLATWDLHSSEMLDALAFLNIQPSGLFHSTDILLVLPARLSDSVFDFLCWLSFHSFCMGQCYL